MIMYDTDVRLKLSKPTLIIVRGVPGAGKSTFAKMLAAKLNADGYTGAAFESDNFFIDQNGVYAFDPTKLFRAHLHCFNEVFANLSTGANFSIVANTFVLKRDVQQYVKAANLLNYDVIIYRMTNHFKNVHDVPEDTLKRMRDNFANVDDEIFIEAKQ